MSRPVIHSIRLRLVLPGLVLAAFVVIVLSTLFHQQRQWGEYIDQQTQERVGATMLRLQRSIGEALLAGDIDTAEREITLRGVDRDLKALAALDGEGRVLLATSLVWKGKAAAEVMPHFEASRFQEVLRSRRPLVDLSDDNRFLTAYFPLTLAPQRGELRPTSVGGLFLCIDQDRVHRYLEEALLEDSLAQWLALLGILAALLWGLQRFVARPVQELTTVATTLPEGEWIDVEVRGRGEIARLGHAFNRAGTTVASLLMELGDRERRYRTIVDNAGPGILLVDRDLRVVELNRTLRQWFPEAKVGAERCSQFPVDLGSGDCETCNIPATLKDGVTRESVLDMEVHGRRRRMRVLSSAVLDERGTPQGCVEILEDITEQEEVRRQLEQSARALRALGACNAAVVRARSEHQLLEEVCRIIVAEAGYRMAWIGRAELDEGRSVQPRAAAGVGEEYLATIRVSWGDNALGQGPTGTAIRERRVSVIGDIHHDPRFAPWREAALARGYQSSIALPLISGDWVYGALSIYAVEPDAFAREEVELLRELAATLAHGLRALQDQAARLAGERELASLNAELELRIDRRTAELQRANEELEAFTYSVSHDLRAPLRGIDGFSKILLDKYADQLEPQAGEYLGRVRAASQRMGRLIDDLLGLSRINRHPLRLSAVDLSDLARQVIAELQGAEPQRQVEVLIEPGLSAHCDPRLARVVLDNLLGNAWKYTARSERPRVELAAVELEGEPGFVVRDNGAGFDMKYADKLFAPFQRLHQTSEFEGTGVGLATVQRVLARHQGRIAAEAEPGRGAAFRFHFGAPSAAGNEGAYSDA